MSYEHRYATLNIGGLACQIGGYCPWHPERKRVEAFIASRFLAAHGAQIQHFMPLLVALETDAGELLALAGIRAAHLEPLFLEHYLDGPVERAIASLTGIETPRSTVVEVGNLAAIKPGHGRYLFAALTDLLADWDFDWLACTGTTAVQNIFHRLGMMPLSVTPAQPDKIPGGGVEWGTYYSNHPRVMIGSVAKGRELAKLSGILDHVEYARVEDADVLTA